MALAKLSPAADDRLRKKLLPRDLTWSGKSAFKKSALIKPPPAANDRLLRKLLLRDLIGVGFKPERKLPLSD